MRWLAAVLFMGGLLAVASLGTAQPPEGPKGEKGDKGEKGGKGFPGGRGGFGPPAIGQILPPFIQTQLKLTDDQKKELDSLQKDVDAKLAKILTADQKKTLQQMKERGPGGFGGRRPGGPGGPDGNPPPKGKEKED